MENVRRIYTGPEWEGFWNDLGLDFLHFADIGLDPQTPDSEVWRRCQRESLVLVTANRNSDGPESLGAMIATENQPACPR
jgi:Domain of unknown function (DUF5615)